MAWTIHVDPKHEHFANDWSKNAYGSFKLNSRTKITRKISYYLNKMASSMGIRLKIKHLADC